MRASRHPLLAAFALIAFLSTSAIGSAGAQTAIRFSLDSRIDGATAPFLLALDRGYYKAEGLDVTIEPGANPAEPITRIASGGYDMAVADINAVIRLRDQTPAAQIKPVFMVYNR